MPSIATGSTAATCGQAGPLVDDDVAGQQRTEVPLGLQRPVRVRRVARTEDEVRLRLLAQLLAERRLDVDLGQHAEALDSQRLACVRHGLGKGELRDPVEHVRGACRGGHVPS
jgi:hypothetical protein